jgi:hypothetical protein
MTTDDTRTGRAYALARQATAIQRIRDAHPRQAGKYHDTCGMCTDSMEDPATWPCPTIAELDGPATADHTRVDFYRAPGADRLWTTRGDAAYYNAPGPNFTAAAAEPVAICCECSGEPGTTVLYDEVALWPCPTIAALDGEATT